MRALQRELTVLRRPAFWAALVATLLLLLAFTSLSQQAAARNWTLVEQDAASTAKQIHHCIKNKGQAACTDQARMLESLHQRYRGEQQSRFATSSVAQSPLGAGGIAAGFLVSLPGLVVLFGLGAVHTAGEWAQGTVRVLAVRFPRRIDIYVAKIVSLWLAGVLMLGASWIWLIALGRVYHRWWEVPPISSSFAIGAYTAGAVVKALAVLAAISAVTVMASVLVRHVLGAFGALLAGLLVTVAMTAQQTVMTVSPAYWLAGWMRWDPNNIFGDHVWIDRFPLTRPDAHMLPGLVSAGTGLLTATALVVAVGWIRLRRTDVGG